MAATLAVAVACTPSTSPSPDPTDPREIVVRSLQSTAALRTVRIAVVVESGQVSKSKLNAHGDVDFVNREITLSAVADSDGPGSTMDFVLADGMTYNRWNGGDWSVSGIPGHDPLAGVPTVAEIVERIAVAVRDPASTVTLLEPVDGCGQAGCHRVHASIPRKVVWRALQPFLNGGAVDDATSEPPDYIPDLVLDTWVEKGTLRLMQGTNGATIAGSYFELSFVLSRHDEPLTIVAPVVATRTTATPVPTSP